MVARMQNEDESPDGEMSSEDAIATVNRLIEEARRIVHVPAAAIAQKGDTQP
jgi:hypothetical protein